MKKKTITEAWRDRDAYEALTEAERAALPDHPAGLADVPDSELEMVAGGVAGTHYSHCEPTASWCDDCGSGGKLNFR